MKSKAGAALEVQQRHIASMVPRAIRAYEAFHHIPFGRASEAPAARSSAGIRGSHVADVLNGKTRGGVGGIEESTFGKTEGSNSYTKPFDRVIQCHDGCMPDPSSQRSK